MESNNFQHILSWQARNDPAVPTSYRVFYRPRRNWDWTTARQCSGTAQLSCDLTEDFKDTEYYVFVQSITGTRVFNSSVLHFAPLTQRNIIVPSIDKYKVKISEVQKESIRRWVYPSWIFPAEEVDSMEVIPREVKPKASGGSGSGSDSDSEDSDSSALWDHDYTRRGVLGRAPPAPGTPPVQYSENRPPEDSGTPGTASAAPEPRGSEEHHSDLEGEQDTGGEGPSPLPELSCQCPAGQSGSACFTINLQSVLLGTLEGSGHGPAAALPAQGHEGLWQCDPALEAKDDTGTGHKALGADDFQEWQNSPSEEESDSSESDTEQVTGYMRR
ncbi:PREDICTED: uncharacterized protein LOC108509594 [Lepidothrix coronata]|uniref:Uncharacterized protein LOC108509594 n=1 Tax=Lepidothrix coronata TaxID=321398 RepID=A0A6J0J6N8_9PASS|nr:PREDICTED: uncharacterized protein LOC108509594 [Lepidothrix coronata]